MFIGTLKEQWRKTDFWLSKIKNKHHILLYLGIEFNILPL